MGCPQFSGSWHCTFGSWHCTSSPVSRVLTLHFWVLTLYLVPSLQVPDIVLQGPDIVLRHQSPGSWHCTFTTEIVQCLMAFAASCYFHFWLFFSSRLLKSFWYSAPGYWKRLLTASQQTCGQCARNQEGNKEKWRTLPTPPELNQTLDLIGLERVYSPHSLSALPEFIAIRASFHCQNSANSFCKESRDNMRCLWFLNNRLHHVFSCMIGCLVNQSLNSKHCEFIVLIAIFRIAGYTHNSWWEP